MKIKSKSHTSKRKKAKARRPTTSRPKSDLITRKACKDEVIWKLYNACARIKQGEEVKIYLQNVDFPVKVDYKKDFLSYLKRKKIIKDYDLKYEEEEIAPIIFDEPVEPSLDLLPFTSFEDLENAPKRYSTVDQSEIDYVALIKCNPKKVLNTLKKKFERVDQKRKEIMKREKIEDLFKKERVYKCGELRLGLESGNIIYGATLTNLVPGGQEYKILKLLMKKFNKRVSYEKLCRIIFGNEPKCKLGKISSDTKRSTSLIIRNIKRKLEIVGPKSKNQDLFKAGNGYMIICD